MTNIQKLHQLVKPIATELGVSVYDLTFSGGLLRVYLDRTGGIDLDTLAEANRRISLMLDIEDPIPGRYTLEVSSPGLERPLRTAEHWRGVIGEQVSCKLRTARDGQRRFVGVVASSTDTEVVIACEDGPPLALAIDEIERANTVFHWESGSKRPAKEGVS